MEQIIDTSYIHGEVQRAIVSSFKDSSEAIGIAKNLVETTCKHILEQMEEDYTGLEFLQLNKKARKCLGVEKTEKNEKIPGVQEIMTGLNCIVSGMAELRNSYGNGHGKQPGFSELPIRYGKLAISVASSYIEFLLESMDDLNKRRNHNTKGGI